MRESLFEGCFDMLNECKWPPIIGVTFGWLIAVVGVAEVDVWHAVVMRAVARLATAFCHLPDWPPVGWLRKPCFCFGNPTGALRVLPRIADAAVKIILAYLVIDSYGTTFWPLGPQKSACMRAAAQ